MNETKNAFVAIVVMLMIECDEERDGGFDYNECIKTLGKGR